MANLVLLRACVSAAFRLSVTVTYGYDADQMYTLGPVVFWVLAETTCGFFIVCMPCLPKILKDKGIISRVKRRLGMRVTTAGASGPGSSGYGKYGYRSNMNTEVSAMSRSVATADAYYKLDEEGGGGVPMGHMKTESMERLRRPGDMHDAKGGIMRTTQVAVHVHGDGASQTGSDEVESIPRRGNQTWYH